MDVGSSMASLGINKEDYFDLPIAAAFVVDPLR